MVFFFGKSIEGRDEKIEDVIDYSEYKEKLCVYY